MKQLFFNLIRSRRINFTIPFSVGKEKPVEIPLIYITDIEANGEVLSLIHI